MLDSTVVALALPTIERDLRASADGIQWIFKGYLQEEAHAGADEDPPGPLFPESTWR
jgi:hypothetical protein